MKLTDRQDNILSLTVLIVEILIFSIMFWTVADGIAPGLDSGHPPEYLESTCVACAALLAVIPVLRLTGIVKMPWWFNFLLIADVYIYSISLCLGMYLDVPWWGFFGHVLSTMSVGAVVFLALCIIEKKTPDRITFGSNAGLHCFTLMISLAFGGIWEVMEGYIDIVAGQSYMSYGVFDSLDDLRADLVGSVIMVILAEFILRNKTPKDVADSTMIRNPFKKHKRE